MKGSILEYSNLISLLAIIVSIGIATWELKNGHMFETRPLLYACIYSNMDYLAETSPRNCTRVIVNTRDYLNISNKNDFSENYKDYKEYKFLRIVNHTRNDAMNVHIKFYISENDNIIFGNHKKKIHESSPVIEYKCFRVAPEEELMIYIPFNQDRGYNFKCMRAEVTYCSMQNEKFSYTYIHPTSDKRIVHYYLGKSKLRTTFKQKIEVDNHTRHVQI